MKFLSIVLFAIAASVVYGVSHDQVALRLCVEYVTVGRAGAVTTEDPVFLALVRGVGTWWVGAALGLLLASAARFGRRPRLRVPHLVLPVLWTILVSAASSVAAGLLGHWLATRGLADIPESLAPLVPESEHIAYVTSLWAHWGGGVGGVLMGLAVVVRTWNRRGVLRRPVRARPKRR